MIVAQGTQASGSIAWDLANILSAWYQIHWGSYLQFDQPTNNNHNTLEHIRIWFLCQVLHIPLFHEGEGTINFKI
jgi:thiamine kinase-like enzyme